MTSPYKKVFLFLSFLLITLFAIDRYVQHLIRKCPQGNIAKVNEVMMHKLDKAITVWGASTARVHFDAPMIQRELGMECFNMGLDGTPFHQYSGLLKEYIDYSEKSKVLVLTIDINGFGKRNALYQGYGWLHFIRNDNMYEALKSVDRDLAIKSRYVPLYYLTAYDRRFLGRCMKWVYVGPDMDPELDSAGYHPNHVPWEEKQHRVYNKPFNVAIEKDVIVHIQEVITVAKEKGIKVAIVVPPCYQEALTLILNLAKFESTIQSFEHHDVRVFNYLGRPICNSKLNFSNNTHLNAAGASLFTKEFSRDLQHWLKESEISANVNLP